MTKRSVRNYLDRDQLTKDISFSVTRLTEAMMDQGALFVHYGIIHSKSQRQTDRFKTILEVTEAKAFRKLRSLAAKSGDKVPHNQLEREVAIQMDVVVIKNLLAEAKQVESIAKAAYEGFRHRKDMLIQQGLISREEMKGEASISRRTEAHESKEDQKQRILDKMKPTNKDKT